MVGILAEQLPSAWHCPGGPERWQEQGWMELKHFPAPRVLPAMKPSLIPQDHTWTILRSFALPWITVHKFFLQPVGPGEKSFVPAVRAEGGRKLNEMLYLGSQRFCL